MLEVSWAYCPIYYRRFIQNFAEIAAPLHRLTAKTTEKFKWNQDCDLAFIIPKKSWCQLLIKNSWWIVMLVTMVWERSYHSGKTGMRK